MAHATREIVLLPAEQLLREFLLECAIYFPGLEIWVTGGWVRDRLLGIASPDLDLSLSNITGKEFGTFFGEFFRETRDRLQIQPSSSRAWHPRLALYEVSYHEEECQHVKKAGDGRGQVIWPGSRHGQLTKRGL